MPLARIETRRVWAPEQVQAIIEAIYQAQREALKVPEDDRQIRFYSLPPEHFHVPPGKSENYTLVEITLFAGRSVDAKRALYSAIVRNLGALGIAANDVLVVVHEAPLENWGIRGGQAACDVELGFRLDV
ncbi:tautomerase family protein [Niveibacterium umoris]|uniref:Phenylpyruvate tautomerase PptA (4-oxalocrotonate tautomerase family) n=1 Tax=Niveibacterium umoris TaxID=1193620 RepID=A0A840BFJ5_9RHOO|nr:tautomerase family protein [Niveibacterium umoris]MBB4011800.1 phenylpyruvate tautomerase PptA (4-oxalocrotonate tautomerase family) [Niveibacterium umoris]